MDDVFLRRVSRRGPAVGDSALDRDAQGREEGIRGGQATMSNDNKKIFRDGVAHITQEGYEQIRKAELDKWRGDPIDPLRTPIGGVKMPEPKPGLLDAAKAYVDQEV